jgi:PAS domain S-box-containing protein
MKEEDQVRDYEVTLLRKDGSSIEVSASARFYTNDAGEREGVEGIFRDISERKKTTRALIESEERYRRFVQHFHGIAYQAEWPAFTPILFQGDVQAITGYSESDFIQGTINWLDLIHPQDQEILSAGTHGLIRDQSAVRTLEYRILHRSGEWKWVTDTAQSVAEVFSHPGLIQGTVQDITARKLAENEVKEKNEDLSVANEELNSLLDELKRAEANLSFRNQELNNQQVILNQSHKALREANRQLNLLSSITRHDILNKITIMNGYLTLVRDEAENNGERILEYLEIIEEVTRTIEYQIEFTRIYQDLGTQEPQWIPIHTLISSINVPGMIQMQQDISNIEIYTDPICGKVFENLLDNTLRHGERVTKLIFSSHMADDWLVITWEDDGVGIQEREKEQIFQRGYGKNTGFGLFLVREILSITGIRILENGVPGKGARFEILVPKGGFRVG